MFADYLVAPPESEGYDMVIDIPQSYIAWLPRSPTLWASA